MAPAFKAPFKAKLNEMIAEKQVQGAALRDAIDEMLTYDLYDLPANVRFLAGLTMLAKGMTRPQAIKFTIDAMEADIRAKMSDVDIALEVYQKALADLDEPPPDGVDNKHSLTLVQK